MIAITVGMRTVRKKIQLNRLRFFGGSCQTGGGANSCARKRCTPGAATAVSAVAPTAGEFACVSGFSALALPDSFNQAVLVAARDTRIGGSWRRQLSGTDPDCATSAAVERLQVMGKTLHGEDARTNQQLYTLLLRKQELLSRARRDVALKARLDLWLYIHVPGSVALLAALIAHVFSVFFYW